MNNTGHSHTIIPPGDGSEFSPYVVVENSTYIHLTISAARKLLFTMLFKIWPFVIVALLVPVFYFRDGMPLHMVLLLAGLVCMLAILTFTRKTIHEVVISNNDVEIFCQRGFKKYKEYVAIADVAHIYLRVVYGKGGGAMFSLRKKDGQLVEFLVFPMLFMKRENIIAVIERLKNVLGLPFNGSFFGQRIIDEAAMAELR